MSRKTQIILAVFVTVVGFAAAVCFVANNRFDSNEQAGLREVRDMSENVVKIPADPRRILSLCSSATDTIVRLGEVDKILAIDEYNKIIPGADKAAVIGKGSAISQEQVLSLGIDLAFVWWYQDDAANMLERLSVPVVRICSGRAEKVPEMIRLVGECLNKSKHAEQLAKDVADYVHEASAENSDDSQKPRVYLELYGPYKTVGKGTYICDIIELAGAVNIADRASGSMLISAEQLIKTDPEVILFVKGFETFESISERSGMAKLSAIRNQKAYSVDRYWLVSGAGLPEAVEKLRTLLNSYSNPER